MFSAQVAFTGRVSLGGYQWKKWDEMKPPPGAAGPERGFDMVLTEVVGDDVPVGSRAYELLKDHNHAALFKRFADIEPENRDAAVDFANEFGPLGRERPSIKVLVPVPDREDKATLTRVVPMKVCSDATPLSKRVVGRGDLACDWDSQPFFMRNAIRVWDLFRVKDRVKLSDYFCWEVGNGGPQWVFDAHREQYPRPELTMREAVYDRQVWKGRDWTGAEDVADVAEAFLRQIITDNVRGFTRTIFDSNQSDGKPSFLVMPNDLLTAIWMQFGGAVAGGRMFRRCKCEGCQEWFAVGTDGRSTRQVFCNDRCKFKDYRQRKAEPAVHMKQKANRMRLTKPTKKGRN